MADASSTQENTSRLTVGYVAGAHGVGGLVRIQLFDDRSDALRSGALLVLVDRTTKEVVAHKTVESLTVVPGKAAVRAQLDGVNSREGADALKGLTVEVDRAALPQLDEDEFYLADAIGLAVERELADGTVQPLGKVVAVTTNGAQDLFEIEFFGARGRAQRWLIPVMPGFVKDVDERRVLVDPPQGLLPAALEQP